MHIFYIFLPLTHSRFFDSSFCIVTTYRSDNRRQATTGRVNIRIYWHIEINNVLDEVPRFNGSPFVVYWLRLPEKHSNEMKEHHELARLRLRSKANTKWKFAFTKPRMIPSDRHVASDLRLRRSDLKRSRRFTNEFFETSICFVREPSKVLLTLRRYSSGVRQNSLCSEDTRQLWRRRTTNSYLILPIRPTSA